MIAVRMIAAATRDNAVCLDGTPGTFYHRPGTGTGANKWYIRKCLLVVIHTLPTTCDFCL